MEINRLHQILEALYKNNNSELALELLKENIGIKIDEKEENSIQEEEKNIPLEDNPANKFNELISKNLSPDELEQELNKMLDMEFELNEDFEEEMDEEEHYYEHEDDEE